MKTVHWQLPFCSLKGTQYRIDIYADGTVTAPVQLTGAATPFETAEDASDNFFEPVRPQTATIHIINDNLDDLAELQPANATDRPVRVINLATNAVEWQGFVSPESYSQEYNSRPHSLDLTCNSVLAAMANVKLNTQPAFGLANIDWWLSVCANTLPEPIGNSVVFVTPDWIKYKHPDYSSDVPVYNEQKWSEGVCVSGPFAFTVHDNDHGDGTIEQSVEGITPKAFIESICKTFGFCARERGATIYLLPILRNNLASNVSMSSLLFMGINHTFSRHNAARYCEVVADVNDAQLEINKEATPCYPELTGDYLFGGPFQLFQAKQDTYSNTHFLQSSCYMYYSSIMHMGTIAQSTWSDPFGRCGRHGYSGIQDIAQSPSHSATILAGACFAKYGVNYTDFEDPKDCIHAQFFPVGGGEGVTSYGQPIIRITNPIKSKFIADGKLAFFHYAQSGRMRVYLSATAMGYDDSVTDSHRYTTMQGIDNVSIYLTLRIGSKYYIGTQSAPAECKFDSNGQFEQFVVMPYIADPDFNLMGGDVELCIYPILKQTDMSMVLNNAKFVSELMFDDITVEYQPGTNYIERSNAHTIYREYNRVSANDGQSISLDLATYNNNRHSFNLLCDSEMRYIVTMLYNGFERRPESELLARMTDYYESPRSVISLIVQHLTSPLPLTRLTGYDGRTYLPLAESRDWRTDTSTITCFEAPE